MTSTGPGNSKRLSMALETAVAGVVLAAGISVGSFFGWVKPAGAGSVLASSAAQADIPVTAPSTPQVVLVPVAPTSPQSTPVALTTAPLEVGSRASRGEREQRPGIVRATTGERDDD